MPISRRFSISGPFYRKLFLFLPSFFLLTLTAVGCATNPATGKSQLNFYSEASEIQMGKEADAEISAQMGVVNDADLQGYVSRVGKELAAKSERPNLPWSFKVMDDPMVNAFALPGGFIYVTRGILGHLSSEAELASVLGHEIGHVTAQHSVNQMSKAQLAQGGLLVGMVLAPELAGAADLAGLGMQALFMKYGRDDERQADDLGLRYMSSGGFETREMPKVFRLLGEVSQRSGAGRIPSWLSSHPDPGARANRTSELIAERSYPPGEVNGAPYVERLDGLTFGADPRLGFFEGGVFYHPELRFQMRFPANWKAMNESSRVVAMHPDQVAAVELQVAQGSSPEDAARRFASSEGITARGSRRVRVGGLDATAVEFEAPRQQGTPLVGTVLFVAHQGRLFQLLGLSVQERWSSVEGAVEGALASFSVLTDRDKLEARPQRIEVVRLPRAMSFTEFERQYPSDAPAETIRLINRISDPQTQVAAGTPLKRIVGRRVGG